MRDWDGDAFPEPLVSAPKHDAAGANAGRVYLFSGFGGALRGTVDGQKPGSQLGCRIDGDVRPSPAGTFGLLSGSWRFKSAGQSNRGRVYRHELDPF